MQIATPPFFIQAQRKVTSAGIMKSYVDCAKNSTHYGIPNVQRIVDTPHFFGIDIYSDLRTNLQQPHTSQILLHNNIIDSRHYKLSHQNKDIS
jgi:hypothetical protein